VLRTHGLEYPYAFGDDLASDAVSRDDGDEVLFHAGSI
jgi:hypothetical protein